MSTSDPPVRFRLYVAGSSPNSAQALANLRQLCLEFWSEPPLVEVVDVLHDPSRALADGIIVTPTLLDLSVRPPVRIIGNLSARERVLAALGLPLDTP